MTSSTPLIDPLRLGATMYIPVIHPAVGEVVTGQRYRNLKSVVLCLEDALAVKDVETGLQALRSFLSIERTDERVLTFVRPRSMQMAEKILQFEGIDRIDGFVVPKITIDTLHDWLQLVENTPLALMATLESQWVFDPQIVDQFIAELDAHDTRRLTAFRLGGNDLLSCLGLRCIRGRTSYEGPLQWLMSRLICRFLSKGYALTAPVYDVIDDEVTLRRECHQDVDSGFVGKTAIHPSQIAIIHDCFAVTEEDVGTAQSIVEEGAGAVFKRDGAMVEPATHTEWAKRILKRHEYYGVRL